MATYCKYYKEEEYQSLDGGITWTAMGVYRKGDLLEFESPDCGTPTPSFDGKFKATYTGGITYSAACDDNTTLESGDTKPSGYQYTAMTTAQVGDCITRIGNFAFDSCSGLTSIVIPSGVTSIGQAAFDNCNNLRRLNSYVDGVFNIPSGVTNIGSFAFDGCRSLTSIVIPSGVTSIGMATFQYCTGLTSVTIPDRVTSIGTNAFSDCSSITRVTIPSGVTTINTGVFQNCSSLTSIDIPDSVTSIGRGAFFGCRSLTSVTIGTGVTSIGNTAFMNCSGLASVTVNATTPPTLSNVNAFTNTPIASGTGYIYVPCNSVDSYKAAANWSTYANQILGIPPCGEPTPTFDGKFKATYSSGRRTYSAACDGNTTLTSTDTRPSGYEYSAMTTAQIGPCVTSIGDGAFRACSGLSSVTIPDSVTSIGQFAFRDCTGLTSVTIGSGITSIDFASFYQCSSLTSCTINAQQPPTLGDSAIYRTNNCPIYVSCASVDAYKAAIGWSTYADRIQGIPPCSEPTPTGGTKFSATYTGGRTYSAACDGNTTLTSGDTRPSGYVASAMTTAEIGSCVTIIGYRAFAWCYSLPSITIPDSVTSIGDDAFYGCVNFKRLNSSTDGVLNIPSGVTSIGNDAFAGCSGLTSVVIPDSVTSIGGAFPNCNNLTNVAIGSGVTSIGKSAFVNCRSLSSITIPNSVTSIGRDAFYGCYGLTSCTIGSGITSIGYYAFYNCNRLASLTINASIPPTLSGLDVFDYTPIESGTGYIYVPCNSVDVYKEASGWSTYADRIQGIPPCSEPTPTGGTKFYATYTGGTSYSAACNGNTTLVSGITKPSGYDYYAMQTAQIGSCVTSIGYGAFLYCYSLSSVTIPDSVTNIESFAFRMCTGLTSIDIPDSVTSIGNYAFNSCSGLTSVDIPSDVTSIGTSAFTNCSGLASVTVNATTPPTLGDSVFDATNCPIIVPSGSVDAYKAASGWSTYADRIQPIT